MDIDTKLLALIGLYISAANFLLTWGVALYMYLANKNKVTNERITKLETDLGARVQKLDEDVDGRLDDYGNRITALEESDEHGPTHHDLGKLHEKVNEVDGQFKELRGEVKGIRNLLDTIHRHLMQGG
ncbi:hypothetical protein DLREEDagrD3_28820 [Denitratisoma sp. agr-D3]